MYTLQMGWKTSLELMLKIEHGTHVKMSGVQTEPIVAMAFEPIAAGAHGCIPGVSVQPHLVMGTAANMWECWSNNAEHILL